ncbi:hypothetical protein HC752_08310 [Vibrio sp. S9_S30]|uniref:hypothetical protein n=1 Tax=Vibrio sp. S9_S30 TaxID=2720226 RepID=UPI001680440E|nr:hypothetical protein [Vibrio sp. S9_S30]MBD1556937.1 hypothetical protein [Vibrio sp. S9_S30]
MTLRIATVLASLIALPSAAEFSGQVNLEHRQFFQSGLDGQGKEQTSLVLKPQWYWTTESGNGEWSFTPFARLDRLDKERTHADIRELQYLHVFDGYEVRAGIGKVFWGVTESAHLVDVVNQSDGVESLDGEQKLGQPMVQFTFEREWGTVDALVLPYFRERTFSGKDGRFRPAVPVSDDALYESSKEEQHVDFALRYSQMLGDWDIGLSYFNGTSRDPYFRMDGGALKPYYAQMSQVGLDAQGGIGDWLWKLETIYRDSFEPHTGVVAGFEYTLVGLAESDWDVGMIVEYLYDSRGNNAQNIGQNDVFFGARLIANDAEGTEFLAGVTQDLDNSDVYNGRVEASSRINNQWKWRVDAWLLQNRTPTDLLYVGRQDDFVELSLEYYF